VILERVKKKKHKMRHARNTIDMAMYAINRDDEETRRTISRQ